MPQTRILLFVLLTFANSVLLFSTNYYVSMNGSNSNLGTSASPFATIQHAADLMIAGDTTFVLPGTYAGFDFRSADGAPDSPVVFMALGEDVIINSNGPIREDGINIENVDHIVIDGFSVIGMVNGGNGIRVVNADFCIVRNCFCDQNDERGIFKIEMHESPFFRISKQVNGNWEPEYIFSLKERSYTDFTEMCLYHQTSADSHFTK